jgi:DNA processing protein
MSKKSSIHAINYSLLMDLIGYSQAQLEKFNSRLDELVFVDQSVDRSTLREILHVTDEKIVASSQKIKASLADCEPDDISVITIKDEKYPPLLKQMRRPPIVLFYRGFWELTERFCVSVVGSRQATANGILRAQKVALMLTQNDYTIVSGLAKGIDTAAQTATIKAGGKTIGVIGTPIDKYYPNENKQLQNKIAGGHLLISQFPLQQPGSPYNFPQRNYTMCGLSLATVIVEASETSGALHQARACIQEGRTLFIMKSLLENKQLTWPRTFVDKGAIILNNEETLLDELEIAKQKKCQTKQQLNVFGQTATG